MTVQDLIDQLSKLTDEQKKLPVIFEYVNSQDGSDYDCESAVGKVFVVGRHVYLSEY